MPVTPRLLAIALLLTTTAGLASAPSARSADVNPFGKINHFVIIYTENRSFDSMFGDFPGADGFVSAKDVAPQVDTDGSVLKALPPVHKKGGNDERFNKPLPNAPFDIAAFVPADQQTPDLVHKFYQEQEQIDGGRMDRFAAVSDAGGLVMGYYPSKGQQLADLAHQFTLLDHFHHAAFGSSFLNHFFLVCACAPKFENAPAKMIAKVDPKTGFLARAANSPTSAMMGAPVWAADSPVTPDFYGINTIQPTVPPLSDKAPVEERLPLQMMPTIGERLSAKGISWAWYAGGWNDVLSGKIKVYTPPENFQPHHQPFNYFAAYAPGKPAREEHLKDGEDLMAAIKSGSLPGVAFYKPIGENNEHPGYTNLTTGDAHVASVIRAIMSSPNWADTMIIMTADENGGSWDHVAPPKIDRWGPGLRVPTLIVSPFAKKGFIDHTVYDTTAILKTLEVRYGLEPLGTRDGASADFRNAFTADVAK
jgi:acid phosphatase